MGTEGTKKPLGSPSPFKTWAFFNVSVAMELNLDYQQNTNVTIQEFCPCVKIKKAYWDFFFQKMQALLRCALIIERLPFQILFSLTAQREYENTLALTLLVSHQSWGL